MSNQTLILGEEFALRISTLLSDSLLPGSSGYYSPGHVKPIFEDNVVYYIEGGKEHGTPVDIVFHINNQVSADIYDSRGRIIAPASVMRRAKKVFTYMNQPRINPRAFEIVKEFIYNHLESVCPHSKKGVAEVAILSHLVLLEEPDRLMNALAYILEDLELLLAKFINRDNWNIYIVSIVGNSVVVEKDIDYRISEWERLKGIGAI